MIASVNSQKENLALFLSICPYQNIEIAEFTLRNVPLTKGSSSPRHVSFQITNILRRDRNWGKVGEVARSVCLLRVTNQ